MTGSGPVSPDGEASDGRFPGIVVAGIPIVHEAPADWVLRSIAYEGWQNGRATEPPLVISHRSGSGAEAIRLIDAAGADETYSTDARGELAVRFGPRRPGERQQWMRTIRAGYHYELTYEDPQEFGLQQWRWERAILMYALAARGSGLMVHAAAFLTSAGAVLCPGASGAGKSTLANQVAERLGREALLSDDRVAVTVRGGDVRAWGTPYYSSGRYVSGADAPLRAIVFPGRSNGGPPVLAPVRPTEAIARMLRTLGAPFWSEPGMTAMLETLDAILGVVPAFEYRYTPAAGAADNLLAELS